MGEIKQYDPLEFGFAVSRTANGFIVGPNYAMRRYEGGYVQETQQYVFNDMTALAAWLLAEEAKR